MEQGKHMQTRERNIWVPFGEDLAAKKPEEDLLRQHSAQQNQNFIRRQLGGCCCAEAATIEITDILA